MIRKIFRKIDSLITYIKDIPWLLFNRKPRWKDADPEQCERWYCSYCGKPFNRQ